MVNPLSYFLCYTITNNICGMVHVKDPLLAIRKNSLCRDSNRFLLSLSGPLLYVQHQINIDKTCFNSVYVHHVQVCKHGPDLRQFVKHLMKASVLSSTPASVHVPSDPCSLEG